MAGTTVNVSVRMDAGLKAEAESLFSELGLSFGAAVNVFVRQAVRQGGLPFKVKLGKEGKKRPEPVENKTERTKTPEEMQKQPVNGEMPSDYASLEEFFAKLDAG